MKKNKHRLVLPMLLLLLVAFASCSNLDSSQSNQLTVNDPCHILHPDLKDSLAHLNPLYPTRLEVIRQVPFGSEIAIVDSLWNLESTSVLIVASQHPEYVFVRLDEQLEGAMSSALEGTLGSNEYYQVQMSDQIDLNNKIIVVINQLLNSESSLANARFLEIIKGELLGPVYGWCAPDDSWVYRYVYYPAQRPFVWLINLTGNYFIGMLLTWGILFGLTVLLIKKALTAYVLKHRNRTQEQLVFVAKNIGTIIILLVLELPIALGGLSIGLTLSYTGLEYSHGLIEHMGFSYDFVDNFYQGIGSKPSIILTIIACLCIYVGKYDKDGGSMKECIYLSIGLMILLPSSAAFTWSVFLFFLDSAILNYKNFLDDTYIKLRVAGHSRRTSFALTSLTLIGIIGCAFLGNWFGRKGVEIKHDRFQVPACRVVTSDIDKPRPHVEKWFSKFDDELVKTIKE